MLKIAIRYNKHTDHEMIGRTIQIIKPTAQDVKRDLNAFFFMEDLPYYAAIVEEDR